MHSIPQSSTDTPFMTTMSAISQFDLLGFKPKQKRHQKHADSLSFKKKVVSSA